jgi:hypothetical protein
MESVWAGGLTNFRSLSRIEFIFIGIGKTWLCNGAAQRLRAYR